jgi:alkaline phosphatase D
MLIDAHVQLRPPRLLRRGAAALAMMRPLAARVALAFVLVLAAAAAGGEPPLLVTVGDVTDSSAVVWVRGQTWGRVILRYAPEGRGDEQSAELRVSPAANLTGKLRLEGLRPATRYRYAVAQNSDEVQGSFLTAPRPTATAPVRFVWGGDLGSRKRCRHVTDGYPIFRVLAELKPDFFLFVGDTIYADQVCNGEDRVPGADFVARKLPDFWAKHRYNRADPAVQKFFRSTSVYAIWDDHEVRNDFAGTAEPLMPVGRQAFLDYFPILPPAEEPGRLYRKFRWGRLVEVFILDTRQYRRPNAEPDGPRKTMLGPAQRRWLIESVTASEAVWKFIVSSVPLSVPTGRSARDSWSNANVWGFPEEHGTGFAVERDAILRAFRERGVKNLVFLAADVHHAELIRHHPTPEWSFHEFIAGPLSASLGRPRPLDRALGPRSLFALGGVENVGEVAVDPAGLTVRIVTVTGEVRFTHTIGSKP